MQANIVTNKVYVTVQVATEIFEEIILSAINPFWSSMGALITENVCRSVGCSNKQSLQVSTQGAVISH